MPTGLRTASMYRCTYTVDSKHLGPVIGASSHLMLPLVSWPVSETHARTLPTSTQSTRHLHTETFFWPCPLCIQSTKPRCPFEMLKNGCYRCTGGLEWLSLFFFILIFESPTTGHSRLTCAVLVPCLSLHIRAQHTHTYTRILQINTHTHTHT